VSEPPGGLPDLRVVRAGQLVLHEEPDERRVRVLRQRLMAEQVVKNPPVVAEMTGERLVVLDGANRTSALEELAVPHAVVQVVDYAAVSLTTWFHLVAGVAPDVLTATVRAVPGAEPRDFDLAGARAALRAGDIAAYVVDPAGAVVGLGSPADLQQRVALLKAVVATYRGHADIYRVQQDEMAELRGYYSEIAGLVVFPPYRADDITTMADRLVRLPTGITRHVIPRRALRLNTELPYLYGDTPLGEKNRWLSEWTRHKLQAGEIRYYEEPTFLFDE
jgi:hypothetical protein